MPLLSVAIVENLFASPFYRTASEVFTFTVFLSEVYGLIKVERLNRQLHQSWPTEWYKTPAKNPPTRDVIDTKETSPMHRL